MRSKGDGFYRRKQSLIETAVENALVNLLFNAAYNLLAYLSKDADLFNDTYLIMTRLYTPDKDFISEFKRLYRNLKLEYEEKIRMLNYSLKTFEDAFYSLNENTEENQF